MFTRSAILALAALSITAHAQQVPDGAIVPFTSELPACASLCGPLFDVQGACSEPKMPTSTSCFCGDARLQSFPQGTSDVQKVCGPASCSAAADLTKIQTWYDNLCNQRATNPTTTTSSAAGSTGTSAASSGSSSSPSSSASTAPKSWFSTHWKWVLMLIIIILGLGAIWIGAVFIRRRHHLKKEKQIQMLPPVAWGPHQTQSTGGLGEANTNPYMSGTNKEAASVAAPAKGKRLSKFGFR